MTDHATLLPFMAYIKKEDGSVLNVSICVISNHMTLYIIRLLSMLFSTPFFLIARPLLFLRQKIAASTDFKDLPLAETADPALRLWGHTFHNVTVSRRENLLKVSDPKFLSLLKESNRFRPRECAALFGRLFIKNMVKEAADDQTLKRISRSSSSHGPSSRSRAGGRGYRGSSSFQRGGSFGQGGYGNNGYNGGSSIAPSTEAEETTHLTDRKC